MSDLRPGITLLAFTCEERERLLATTLRSAAGAIPQRFVRQLLHIDGRFDTSIVEPWGFDLVLQQPRRGYPAAILNALRQVETEYFFWLEDDWSFKAPVPLAEMHGQLERHPDWTQIRLSKTGRLTEAERAQPLGAGLYASTCGFSANPSLCRTSAVVAGMAAVASGSRGSTPGVAGFENVLTAFYAREGYTNVALDSDGVDHSGYLESTPRQFHMTASLDGEVKRHVYAMGEPPKFWRRLWMVPKLTARCAALAVRQLSDLHAYELAFRVVAAPLTPPGR